MRFPFFNNRLESLELTVAEFRAICATAEILEQDSHGIKVLRLPNGDILKIFRVKRLISSARLYSYARRFCKNAERLRKRDIPTVTIKQLYHLAGTSSSAVLYAPVPGYTVRDLVREQGMDELCMARLGAFIASLHDLGIYFRSLHFGNVVLMPNNQFGLIDIADLRILPCPLGFNRRIRNFYHVCRLKDDMSQLGSSRWNILLDSYLKHSNLDGRRADRIKAIN